MGWREQRGWTKERGGGGNRDERVHLETAVDGWWTGREDMVDGWRDGETEEWEME